MQYKEENHLALSIAKSAKRCAIGTRALRKKLDSSEIKSVRFGRRRVVPVTELERFLETASK